MFRNHKVDEGSEIRKSGLIPGKLIERPHAVSLFRFIR